MNPHDPVITERRNDHFKNQLPGKSGIRPVWTKSAITRLTRTHEPVKVKYSPTDTDVQVWSALKSYFSII